MNLYICTNFKGEKSCGRSTDELVKEAAVIYANFIGMELETTPEIVRGPHGKPYFNKTDIFFSVSHTANVWACLMGNQPVGLDIQRAHKSNWEKIAQRFFTEDEERHIKANGEKKFWQIWTMKEAYVKYLGEDLGSGFKKYSMVEDAELVKSLGEVNILPLALPSWMCNANRREKKEGEIIGSCVLKKPEQIRYYII